MSEKSAAVDAWEALFRAQVTVMRDLNAEFPKGVLSLNEYDLLFNLSRQPQRRARIRDLLNHLLLTQPSVSRLIDRLAAKGMVTKTPDPADARGTIVTLTSEGRAAFRTVAVAHAESIRTRVGSALDPDEMAQLAALCDKLRAGA
jgi:DNA-binding MarR family transcriptional regulator